MKNQFKQDKGTAGLTILLSLIVMLFIIGLIVMIFTLMGTSLNDATYDKLSAVTVTNETGAWSNETLYTVDNAGRRDFASFTVTALFNATDDTVIALANTTAGATGTLQNASAITYADVLVSYTYTWSADNTGTAVINDTTQSIATVTDWFDIFIVIGAMVVLILLTVIIITAIRSSGMVAGGSGNRSNQVGTA